MKEPASIKTGPTRRKNKNTIYGPWPRNPACTSMVRAFSSPSQSDSLNLSTTVCMYCFGEARRVTLSAPRARRQALFQPIAAEQRHRQRDDGRARRDRGENHRQHALVVEQGEQEIGHGPLRNRN